MQTSNGWFALVVVAVMAAAACGGDANATCPPANGTPLASSAVTRCGCFVDAMPASSLDDVAAQVDENVRSNGSQDCRFGAAGHSTELRNGVRIAAAARKARPPAGSDADQSSGVRYNYAIDP